MDSKHKNCSKNIQQICIVRSVDEKRGKKILMLEPQKQKCSSCDGTCSKMVKPSELIEYHTTREDINAGDSINLSINSKDLSVIVMTTLGLPLLAFVLSLCVCYLLKLSDLQSVAISTPLLIITFVVAIKKAKFKEDILNLEKNKEE